MANGAVRIVKIVLYLVVIGSTAAMLYGFVKASSSIERCLFGGSNCMLFGHMTTHTLNSSSQSMSMKNCSGAAGLPPFGGFRVPVGYNEDLCRFCLASAAMQLIVSVIGVLVVYYRLSTGKPGRSGCSIAELLIVVTLTVAALLTSGLVTAGLELFCRNLLHDWTSSYMHAQRHFDEPLHCSVAPLIHKNSAFYSGMHLARTCSFVAVAAWLVHLLISSISAHSYRKNGATPIEEVQSEKERRRRNKEKKTLKKKEKDLDKKSMSLKSKSGKKGKGKSMWDESAAMV